MSSSRPLEIEEHVDGEIARLSLAGELDIATVPRLEQAVSRALSRSPHALTIDLRPLSFMDSSGLREFIVLAERAEREGWKLALVRPATRVLAIFRVTRAEENLPFVDAPPQ